MRDFSLLEILGPIMIGPSSSHTAGAARLGRIATTIAGEGFTSVSFLLHGSFAKTYQGHGTDKALLAGVMGFSPSDVRIRDAFKIADEKNLHYEYLETDLGFVHPNTVRIIFHYDDRPDYYVQGSSIGGGNILITDINGTEIEFRGERPTVILKYKDKKGIISRITSLFAIAGFNIANMTVIRSGRMSILLCEFDGEVDNSILDDINRIDDFEFATFIKVGKDD
ncbi:L-serine ammonia-lyase, iron-sulfur-dependent subunit beta [uncultured Ezakiella sp.]|uniref:L-serine ammonia-lyase, iron-sulfur-dependent subunit beta n=1 Tax=uncultured Ezakiella sp. TaxID=1637529 RepID=UPI0025E943F7|nr:L-serine ammonia-lyase, iron-sulfur-dependent subunit beta [uncultured Ezakiella sp.]